LPRAYSGTAAKTCKIKNVPNFLINLYSIRK
jgi:hypothetical protein